MIRSMTGFARHEIRGPWGELTWELKSVNHRYLETSTRLPEPLRAVEGAIRERVGERIGRGKVSTYKNWNWIYSISTPSALRCPIQFVSPYMTCLLCVFAP